MNKNSILKFLTVFVLACISMFGISCKENEKPGPNKDFVISNDRVPTAYVKAEYNLEQLLVKEEGVSYSVYSLKYTSETEQIGYEGFLFTPVKDGAVEVVFKAELNGKTETSETIKIKVLSNLDYYLINRADVPDAYCGMTYDLNSLLNKQEGATYQVSVYEDENGVTPVAVNDFVFTAKKGNAYYYAQFIASKNGETHTSEKVRIRSLEPCLIDLDYKPDYQLNTDFDVDEFISVAYPDLEYTAEVYRMADGQKVNVPLSGTRFMPTEIDRYYVVFTINSAVKSEPIEILRENTPDVLDYELYLTNLTPINRGYDKDNNYNAEYIREGNSSMKVYAEETSTNFYHTSFMYYGYMDVYSNITDWSNAVLSFWVYNPNEAAIVFKMNAKNAAAGLDNATCPDWKQRAEPNSWTQIVFSLRRMGITEQIYFNPYDFSNGKHESMDSFSVYANYEGASLYNNISPKLSYEYYIDALQMTEYNEEKFPTLNTATEAELLAEIEADEEDKILYQNTNVDQWAVYSRILVEPSVMPYAGTSLSAPMALENSLSALAIKTALPVNAPLTARQFGTAIASIPTSAVQSNIDWTKDIYVTFWLYTDYQNSVSSGYLQFFSQLASVYKIGTNMCPADSALGSTVPACVAMFGEWNYVTMNITAFKEALQTNTDSIALGFLYKNLNFADFNETFYIDGLTVTNLEIPTVEANEFLFANLLTANNFTFGLNNKGVFANGSGLNFTGDYTGNAVSYAPANTYSAVVRPIPRITIDQYDALIAGGYTKLYVWVAGYADNGKTVKIATDSTLYNKSATVLTDKTWTRITFALTNDVTDATISSANYATVDFKTTYGVDDYAAYVKQILFAEGGARLFRFYMSVGERTNEDGSNTVMHCYIGDVGFDEETRVHPVQSDEFAFVYNDTAVENFTFYSGDKGGYLKGNMLDFAGDYTGDAVAYHGKNVYSAGLKVGSRITVEQYDALIAAGYTKLYIWVAGYADNGKTVKIATDSTLYNKSATVLTDKTWTRITFALTNDVTDATISSANYANVDFKTTYGVDDYAAYVKQILLAEGGARLFRFYMSVGERTNEDGSNTVMYCYVGNAGFEK